MPRTKGSKNKKSLTVDYAALISQKQAEKDAAAAEAAKRGEAEAMLKKLLAEGMSADEIIDKLK